jgi:4-hydroxy-2-oxoheptanedioate aldolase
MSASKNSAVTPASLKTRLCRGETVRGLFVSTFDATLCEFIATLGWDFLIADAEHAAIDLKDMENIARACELRGMAPTARVPLTAPADISRFLDAGARGVMVPFVESALEAQRAVAWSKFAPTGRRGLAAPRCGGFGGELPPELFVTRENHETLVIVQIESLRGLDNLVEILAVEGVDVVFIGPTDLSLALGHPQQWTHAKFRKEVEQVARETLRAGKVFGAYAGSRELLSWYESLGARFLAVALEDILIEGTNRFRA